MRQVAVLALFLAAALSGCANGDYLAVEGYQEPKAAEDSNATANETIEVNGTVGKVPVVGDLVLGVDNMTFAAGTPFNVSIAFYPNGTDPVNATTNVTDAPAYEDVFWSVNITQGNITGFQNGTRLPAVFAVNATQAINMTIEGYFLLDGERFDAEALNMTSIVDGLDSGDACDIRSPVNVQTGAEGVYVPYGYAGPGVLGAGLQYNVNFNVPECHAGLTAVLTPVGVADLYLRLEGPSPGLPMEVDGGSVGDSETLIFDPAGGLVPGAYTLRVRGFASVVDLFELEITFR